MSPVNSNFQLLSIIVSFLLGLGFAFLYDLVKAWRRVKKSNRLAVFFQDVIYFFLISLVTFLFLLAFSRGEIRAYVLLPIFLGFVVWSLLISKYICRFFVKIISFIFEIFRKIKLFFEKYLARISGTVKKIVENAKKIQKKPKHRKNNLKQEV